jgi:hypothetical protein
MTSRASKTHELTQPTKSGIAPLRKKPLAACGEIKISGIPLETKDNLEEAIRRIEAWYACEVLDRPPVRFSAHNAQYNVSTKMNYTPEQWKNLWFDTERVVDRFIQSIQSRKFLGETFPVFWPNIGPDAYASFYGCHLTYSEVTSWSRPIIKTWADIDKLVLDIQNPYFRKIEELTSYALERCPGKFWVGYTDLHPGMDCVLAWRGMEQLCFDLFEAPEQIERLVEIANQAIPVGVQGRSLLEICGGRADPHHHRDYVFAECYEATPTDKPPVYLSMIRDRRYKISVYHGQELGELYDLQEDPHEFNNLWNSPEYEKMKNKLLKKCFDATIDQLDPLPQRIAVF